MNERIEQLVKQATIKTSHQYYTWGDRIATETKEVFDKEKFAELIIKKTLDEVKERAYYSGDRAWSDETDRQWVELEFGIGTLADAQHKTGIK